MILPWPRAVVLLAMVQGACSQVQPPAQETFEAPRDLRATLVDDQHVDLQWTYNATAPGGAFVEVKLGPDEDFTMLDAVWAGMSTYRHPDVAPDTRFLYRIHSFFGRPSDPVVVDTGKKGAADQDQAEGPLDDSGGAPPRTSGNRQTSFAPETAPGGLTAQLSSGTGVELHWRDRATGEDGYLVELSEGASKAYRIGALLPPDSTSFRKTALPERTRCTFRVRAYFYGPSSNLAEVLTPSSGAQGTLKRMIEGPGESR
jgi:hypothetical protein